MKDQQTWFNGIVSTHVKTINFHSNSPLTILLSYGIFSLHPSVRWLLWQFILSDPALPMINVASSLLSWNPFRKEMAKWLKQLDLYDEDQVFEGNETTKDETADTLKQVDSDEINSTTREMPNEFEFKRQGLTVVSFQS